MKVSVHWPTVLGCIAVAGAITIAAGCASASRQLTTSATPATIEPKARAEHETPASARSLIDSANLKTQAEGHGYKPEIHDGAVIYCWTDAETGSSIPTKKCVNEDQMREMLLQSRQQRQDMERNEASHTSCPAVSC